MQKEFDDLQKVFIRFLHNFSYSERKVSNYGTDINLLPSEIHMLMEINNNPGISTTKLSKNLRVTKGAVSQVISKLKEKGLIISTGKISQKPEITSKGKLAMQNHEKNHKSLIHGLKEFWHTLDDSQKENFYKILKNLESEVWEV